MMDFQKVIRDFDGKLNGLEGTTRDILNATDLNGMLKVFRTYEDVLSDCKTMGSLRDTSPTSFVASISRKLHSITLLEVDYESSCAVKSLDTDYVKWARNVAVMLPDSIYRPFLRYKISEQMAQLTPVSPWSIKMISSSNIEKWIIREAAEHLENFAENIKSVSLAFPNGQEIGEALAASYCAMTYTHFQKRADFTHLEHETKNIGNVPALKYQLIKKTFDGIAEDIGERVVEKITDYILKRLNSFLKPGMGRLKNLVSSDTFEKTLLIAVKGTLLKSLVLALSSMFEIEETAARKDVAFSIYEVAEESYRIFRDERRNIERKIYEKPFSEVDSKLKSLDGSILSCYKETCDLKRQLEMASHSSWIEIFSQKDFEKTTAISLFAKEYGEAYPCLESIGCVGVKDQFECLIRGEKRRLEGGSNVVVTLYDEKEDKSHEGKDKSHEGEDKSHEGEDKSHEGEDKSHEGDFPLVKLSIKRHNEEHDKIIQFQESHNLQYINDDIYSEIRNKLDNELLRSFSKEHSNLAAIDICTTKSRNGGKDIESCTCIVIFCFAKGFIPIGENIFPREIRGIPTDVREAYAIPFGTRDYNNPIGPGCSVGLKDRNTSGSIGFLLQHRDDGHFAFVSAAHVFFDFRTLRQYADGHQHFNLEEFKVVQQSDADNVSMIPAAQRICGHVESIHFNSTDEENCKDFIVVASKGSRHPIDKLTHPSISQASQQQSGVFNWPHGFNFFDIGIQQGSNGVSVLKVGRTTELTTGKYAGRHVFAVFRVDGTSFYFYDMLKIRGDSPEDFAKGGDSGAGIYLRLRNTLKPFAILEGSKMRGETLAIPFSIFKTVCPKYAIQAFWREDSPDDKMKDDEKKGNAVKSETLHKREDKKE